MKKTLSFLMLMAGLLVFGSSQAFAVLPTIDGANAAPLEWDSLSSTGTTYPYYLELFDPDEADNQIQSMDISHVVLLQELTSCGICGGGAVGSGDADPSNDGIYLLVETFVAPSLGPATGPGVVPNAFPVIKFAGDLLGDGFGDGFNIFMRHYSTDGSDLPAADKVEICVGSFLSCNSIGAVYTDITTVAGTSGQFGAFGRGSVLEYYIPSGAFGTPPSPPGTQFPFNFVGQITYDNGASGPNTSDDVVVGSLSVPEPSTIAMFGFGAAVLGLAGFKKRFA